MKRAGIAIVGMAGWFNVWEDIESFWQNLKTGRESCGTYARVDRDGAGNHTVGATISYERAEKFDASHFGLSPREAERIEPQQRHFLELACQALDDGGYAPEIAGTNVGVFGGANFTSYYELPADAGASFQDSLDQMIGAANDYLATRVAHHLGLKGPALTVQSACSTSLVAVHLACQCLLSGECDAALAGGVSVTSPRLSSYNYAPGGILSPDGYCRAFDADAMGTVFTDGAGVVLLMRLKDALARRHPIYAVIRGSAVNNDGGGKASYMAPSIAGQEKVIRAAMQAASVSPRDIGFIEGHGSATVLGDAIELAALSRVFCEEIDEVGVCHIGSVKSNIGHTASAAGVAGLIKAALALKHEWIPGNANFRSPNPDLDFTISPFTISAEATPWPRSRGKPRYAGVSSFGVGGTNAHAILEEPPLIPASHAKRAAYILTLSARSEDALAASAAALGRRLRRASRRELADVAYTLNVGRRPLEHRAAIVCGNVREAREALAGRAQSTAFGGRITTDKRSVCLMFPGQGSQYPGMGRGLYRDEPAFRFEIDACLATLEREQGLDLSSLFRGDCEHGSEAEIVQTRIAQPLIFMVEYALGRLLMSWGVMPDYAIGHSVGEFAAACLAGIFSLHDAMTLVALRGALMQRLPPGSMLSVAASTDAFELPADLDIAAVNSPRQCVVSGTPPSVDAFASELEKARIPCTRLRASHAFHSRLMDPILDEFRHAVAQVAIGSPAFPLVSSVTGAELPAETSRDPEYWARHVREPVMFAQGLDTLVRRGVNVLVETGPGRQLSVLAQQNGLHRQSVRIINTMHNNADGGARGGTPVLMRAISRIWLDGCAIDWTALHGREKRRMVSLPAYPFERQSFRVEPLAGRISRGKGKLRTEDWLYLPTWRRMVPAGRGDDVGIDSCWLVLEGESSELQGPLATRLTALGERVISVQWGSSFQAKEDGGFALQPSLSADFVTLFETLKSRDLTPSRIVHAWAFTPLDRDDAQPCESDHARERRQQRGIYSLARCLKGHRHVFGHERVSFHVVTSGAVEVTGTEMLRPGAASALAFAKVAPQENTRLVARVMDVDPSLLADAVTAARTFDKIAEGLLTPISERVLALRAEYWWAQGFERCAVPASAAPRLKRGGTYLITGGMGHVGFIFARHFAKTWNARIILVGRSSLEESADDGNQEAAQPTRKERIAELEALGGQAVYIQADASKLEDVRRLRATIFERFGQLDGIVFGAGIVTARGPVHEIDDAPLFEENYAGKVQGLKHALDVFGADRLDFALVLSSISTVLGGLGLCAYSAANQIADVLILAHRRRGHVNWATTNWDLWDDGHFADAERRFSAMLAMSIQPHEGARALEHILALPAPPQVIVSTHDLASRIALWVMGAAADDEPQVQHKRPNLATTYAEVEGELECKVHDILSRILGIETIGRDDDFFEMGGHSILAVRASVLMEDLLPPNTAAPSLYDAPTIRLLAEALRPNAMSERAAVQNAA